MLQMRRWIVGAVGVLAGYGVAGGAEATLPSSGSGGVYNVVDFGAVADGKTLNTAAIQKAIDACKSDGGGKVVVPAGIFRTGPITLAGHLDFHLEKGALVQFSDNRADYPMLIGDFEGKPAVICQSPISGENLDYLSITGEGIIDGAGHVWRPEAKSRMPDKDWEELVASGGVVVKVPVRDRGVIVEGAKDYVWYPSQSAADGAKTLADQRARNDAPKIEDYKDLRDLLRPPLVTFSGCTHLTLEGCTFRDSPAWTIHLLECKNAAVKNIVLWNVDYARNADGIDIDSCSGVVITGSTIYTGDDNICIKSGRDELGRKRGKASENITVDNCIMGWRHGGVAIGSETSGGARNVTVTNCIMRGTEFGLRFKSVRGRGGIVENLTFSNIRMYDIWRAAIGFDLFYEQRESGAQPVNEGTPIFRLISFHNITCGGTTAEAIEIHGLAEMPLSDVLIDHCNLTATRGAVIENVKNLELRDVEIHSTVAPPIVLQNVSGLRMEETTATSENPLPPAPSTRPAAKAPKARPSTRKASPTAAEKIVL